MVNKRVLDVKDNLVLYDDGSVFAYYEIPTSIVSKTDAEGKKRVKYAFERTLQELVQHKRVDIFVLPMPRDLLGAYQQLSKNLSDDTYDLAKYLLNGSLDSFEKEFENGIYEYRSFMSVPLVDNYISSDLAQVAKQTIGNIQKELVKRFSRDLSFREDWWKDYASLNNTAERFMSLLSPERLRTEQTLLIHRLQYLRGQDYDQSDELSMIENEADNIDATLVKPLVNGSLKIEGVKGKSFVKFLPISTLRDRMNELHLIEYLQGLSFPVEIVTKAYFDMKKGPMSIKQKGRRTRSRLKQTQLEAFEKDSVQKGSVASSIVKLEDLEERVDRGEQFISYLQCLVISGKSQEDLEAKQSLLMNVLKSGNVGLSVARADQFYLFQATSMGYSLSSQDKNWIQPMGLDTMSENLFFVGQRVGVKSGFYVGRVDNEVNSWAGDTYRAVHSSSNLVLVDLLLANELGVKGKISSNGAIAIIGETGTGKSYLTKTLFVVTSLQRSQVVYVDPKAEMRQQFLATLHEYEEREKHLKKNERSYQPIIDYIKQISFVTLDYRQDSNAGVLDPLTFLDLKEAKTLILNILNQISERYFNEIKFNIALGKAIDDFGARRAAGEAVGTLNILEDLFASKDETVSEIAEYFLAQVKGTILSLVISDGRNASISMDRRISILEVSGLDLPVDKSSRLTTGQNASLAVMYALGYFCKEFGRRDRKQKTATFFDEAWFFTINEIGRGILKEIKRVGRSMNNFLVLTTQSVSDLKDSDDQTSFGNVFAFLEPNEVEEVLEYMDVPVTDESRELMKNMTTTGQCLYKDNFGHVARMTVDAMFPEISKLFDTVESDLVFENEGV